MSKERLLEMKKAKKAKTPRFIRQDIHKKKRLAKLWRKPRGCDSKKREMRNNRYIVKPGYGTPAELRGKNSEGKDILNIMSFEEIKEIDPKTQVVIVSGKIGVMKRLKIIEELVKLKIGIHNIRNPEEYLKNKKAKIKEKKEKKKKKSEKKEKKKTTAKPKQQKESVEDKLSDEEKKKIEKKEIDKLLTKK